MSGTTPMEIERKFKVREMPSLTGLAFHKIEQAYLTTEPVIRVRKEDDEYYMTYKGKGGMAHSEYNLPLTETAYRTLASKADGNRIGKTRYLIPLANPRFSGGFVPAEDLSLTIELDVFDAPFAPLVIAEIEFPDEATANAYLPEDWFGEEATGDKSYSNAHLSRIVFPE